jgi:hypothetical protein
LWPLDDESAQKLKKAASPSHSIKNDETKNLIGAIKNTGRSW